MAVIDVTGTATEPVFTDTLDQLDDDISRVWVVQYQTIDPLPAIAGFAPVSTVRFDSRFFTGSYRINVVELERTDS